MSERWLLADLGGTNTRVGLAGPKGVHKNSVQSFRNVDFAGLDEVLASYLLAEQPGGISAVCAGVAGPVRNGAAQLTNRDWFIDPVTLRKVCGAGHVHLLNDLQAQGYALNDLPGQSVTPLFHGAAAEDSTSRLVLGLGTGSNVAVVHHTAAGLFVPPAESGHASLPFADGKLADLVKHLGQVQAHRPMESALSGPGLVNIYRWLGGRADAPEAILSGHAAGSSTACEAVELFCLLLGQVAGDLALAHLPMGGLYLIGGMARAVAPVLAQTGFHHAFSAKGPYRAILEDIPISLITDDNAALLGCARYLRQIRAGSPPGKP